VPDARVQAAIDNWAPRFIANGVDPNDFLRTTARVERWDEWLDAWIETGDEHRALAEEARSEISAGEAWLRAAVAYHFAKFVWVLDVERNRETTRRAISALARAHALLDPTARRVEIPFDGGALAANLRTPPGVGRPPLVVLIAGLDSTKEEFFHWEQVFLDRGLATFSLDGPGQGEVSKTSHIWPNYEAAVTKAVDRLVERDDVDPERIGAAGVSLGGYYAPRAAAHERRIKAVVGISGPFNFGDCWDSMPGPTRDTVQHHTGAASPEEARERASQLDLSEAALRSSSG
jgi:predicted alpha/beta-fold hydrolase